MADGHHFEKKRWIAIYLQPFDRFWWNLARWRTIAPYSGASTVKILNFWKSKMAAAAILKITKIAIYPQQSDRSLRNLVRWYRMGFLTSLTFKKFEFHKSKMADGRHFENRLIVISLQPFDRFWWNLARWRTLALYSGSTAKFWIFENSRWRQPPSWKSQKSQYIRSGLTDLYEIWYADAKWVS